MTEEEINCLAKYLGCEAIGSYGGGECKITLDGAHLMALKNPYHSFNNGGLISIKLQLNDLSALTQEDFERMCKEVSFFPDYGDYEPNEFDRWLSNNTDIIDLHWNEADWLRHAGYYLGEECIKKFVKIK